MPKPLNRRQFVTAAIAGAALAASAPKGAGAQRRTRGRPNILFILADDLGYGDLSCYGRPDYQTPNLDRLSAQGVRLAHAYSASPLCTPTRCGFITGRYPARTRIGLEEPLFERRALGDRALTLGLPPEHPTIASLLKQSGYETALIGKWHLGYLPNFGPVQSGFDEYFGIMSGAGDFFTHKDMEGDPDLFEGKVPVERVGYMTHLLTERAVQYISRRQRTGPANSARPFYLSLHYTAPHWPWEAAGDRPPSPELRGPIAFRRGGSLKTYAAMMKSMDDGIGQVLKALAAANLERDTLVIFTSDNGGERFSYNWPFVGQKGSLWEGGIRVPAIVRWPGVVQAARASRLSPDNSGLPPGGRIVHNTSISMDWTATILAAAQTQPNPQYPLDGVDLMPVLSSTQPGEPNGQSTPGPSRTLFWRHANQDAAVKAPWKYLNDGQREYLFNLSIDRREQANFRDQQPELFNQLRAEFKAWEATVLPRPPARSLS